MKTGNEEKMFDLNFTDREDLRSFLESRTMHHRFIKGELILCQLQFGTIDKMQLIDFILEFDDDSIKKALYTLEAKGLG